MASKLVLQQPAHARVRKMKRTRSGRAQPHFTDGPHLAVSVKPLSHAMCRAVRFLSVLADTSAPAFSRNLIDETRSKQRKETR